MASFIKASGTKDRATKNKSGEFLREVKSGVKYEGKRHGVTSYLDKQVIMDKKEQQYRKYGGGSTNFVMIGEDGKPDPNATLNFNNRVFKPNGIREGAFRIIDGKMLKDMEDEYEELQAYINRIAKLVSISDDSAKIILGLKDDEFEDLFSKANDGAKKDLQDKVAGIDEDLQNYNAKPSFLASLHSDSEKFTMGVSKLRKICAALLPIIEDQTTEAVLHDPTYLTKAQGAVGPNTPAV